MNKCEQKATTTKTYFSESLFGPSHLQTHRTADGSSPGAGSWLFGHDDQFLVQSLVEESSF